MAAGMDPSAAVVVADPSDEAGEGTGDMRLGNLRRENEEAQAMNDAIG